MKNKPKDEQKAIKMSGKSADPLIENQPFHARMDRLVQISGSLAALARKAGVSETAVRKWKMGESEPTVGRLVSLARCTGVDVGWLASGEGSPEPRKVGEDSESYATDKPGRLEPDLVRRIIKIVENRVQDNLNPEAKADLIIDLAIEAQQDEDRRRES